MSWLKLRVIWDSGELLTALTCQSSIIKPGARFSKVPITFRARNSLSVFAAFAFMFKVSVILVMIQWNYQFCQSLGPSMYGDSNVLKNNSKTVFLLNTVTPKTLQGGLQRALINCARFFHHAALVFFPLFCFHFLLGTCGREEQFDDMPRLNKLKITCT